MSGTNGRHEALARAQERFNVAIAGLDTATLEREPAIGDWPVRSVVAHLVDWGNEAMLAAEHALGGPAAGHHPITNDDYNDQSVARHTGESWAELKAQLDDLFARARALTARLSPEQLAQPADYPWGGTGTLDEVLSGIDGHQDEHSAQIEDWRASRAAA
jgi:hypothetical protein